MTNANPEGAFYERINTLFGSLGEVRIVQPENDKARFNLLKVIYDELRSHFPNDQEKENGDKAIQKIKVELEKRRRGLGQTFFTHYADEFERELRSFFKAEFFKKGRA